MAWSPLDLARKYGKGKPVGKAHGGGLAYRVPAKAPGGSMFGDVAGAMQGKLPDGASDGQKAMNKVGQSLMKGAQQSSGGGDAGGGGGPHQANTNFARPPQFSPPPQDPQIIAKNTSIPAAPGMFMGGAMDFLKGGEEGGGFKPMGFMQMLQGSGGKPMGIASLMQGSDLSGNMPEKSDPHAGGPGDVGPAPGGGQEAAQGPPLGATNVAMGRPMGAGSVGALNPWAQGLYDKVFAAGGGVGYENGGSVEMQIDQANLPESVRDKEMQDKILALRMYRQAVGDSRADGGGVGRPMGFAPGGGIDNDYQELPTGPSREDELERLWLEAQAGNGVPQYLRQQQAEGIEGAVAPRGLVEGVMGAGEIGAELTGIPSIVRGYNTLTEEAPVDETGAGKAVRYGKGAAQIAGGAIPGMAVTKEGARLLEPAFRTGMRAAGSMGILGAPSIIQGVQAGEKENEKRAQGVQVPAYLKDEITNLNAQKAAKQEEFNRLNDKHRKSGPETQKQALDPLRNDLTELSAKIKEAEGRLRAYQSGVAEQQKGELPFRQRHPGAAEAIATGAAAFTTALPFANALKHRWADAGRARSMNKAATEADKKLANDDIVGFARDQSSLERRAKDLEAGSGIIGGHALPVAKATALGTLANAEAASIPEQVDALVFDPGHPTREQAKAQFKDPDYYTSRLAPAFFTGLMTAGAGHEAGVFLSPSARVPHRVNDVIETGSKQSLERINKIGDYKSAVAAAKDRPALGSRRLAAEEAQATALPANAPLGQRPALGAPLGAKPATEPDIPQPAPTASLGAPRPSDPTSTSPPGSSQGTAATSPPLGAGLGQAASPGATPGPKGPLPGEQSALPPPLGAKSPAEQPSPQPAPAPSRGIDTSAESPFGGAPIGSTQPIPPAKPASGPGTPGSQSQSTSPPPAQGLPAGHRWVWNTRTGVYQVHDAKGDFVATPKDIKPPTKQSKPSTSKRASKKEDPNTTRRDGGAINTARRYISKFFGGGLTGGSGAGFDASFPQQGTPKPTPGPDGRYAVGTAISDIWGNKTPEGAAGKRIGDSAWGGMARFGEGFQPANVTGLPGQTPAGATPLPTNTAAAAPTAGPAAGATSVLPGAAPVGGPTQGELKGTVTFLATGGGLPDRPDPTAQPDHGPAKVGAIVGDTGGREDALPISVKSGSYVIPADVVAALGGGNSLAGMKSLQQQFGDADPNDSVGPDVPIKISDGEYVIAPEQVVAIGQGDVSKGHRVLDQLVRRIRAEHIKTLKSLPGPRQD